MPNGRTLILLLSPITYALTICITLTSVLYSDPSSRVMIPFKNYLEEADEDDSHVVTSKTSHLTVGSQTSHHQLLAYLKVGCT